MDTNGTADAGVETSTIVANPAATTANVEAVVVTKEGVAAAPTVVESTHVNGVTNGTSSEPISNGSSAGTDDVVAENVSEPHVTVAAVDVMTETVKEIVTAEPTEATKEVAAEAFVAETFVTEVLADEPVVGEALVTEAAPIEAAVAEPEAVVVESVVTEVLAAEPVKTEALVAEAVSIETAVAEPIPVANEVLADADVGEPEAVVVESVVTEVLSAEPVEAEKLVAEVASIEAEVAVPIPVASEVVAEAVVSQTEAVIAEAIVADAVPVENVAVPRTITADPIVCEAVTIEPVTEAIAKPVTEPLENGSESDSKIEANTTTDAAASIDVAVAAEPLGPLGLPAFVEQVIANIAVAEGFTWHEAKVTHDQNKHDGFVGELHHVRLTGVRAQNGVNQARSELQLVVKLPPTNPIRRQFAFKLFEREVLVYNELLPAFAAFQSQHGLKPGQAGFYEFAKCYYALYDEANNQAVIIMENLHARGFAMESKFVPLSYDYARTVLEKLAEYHGISLAMKQQRPAEFERYRRLGDMMSPDLYDPLFAQLTRVVFKASKERALTSLDAGETALREKVERLAGETLDNLERFDGKLSEPYSVMLHGDCWINNMMFNHQSGRPLQVNFYDWQLARYGSPVLDVARFVFISTDAALRARHYDDLIQAYHHALRAQLDRLNADVNELLPFTALLRQMKQFGRFALDSTIMIMPILSTDKTNMPDLDTLSDVATAEGSEWKGDLFSVDEKNKAAYSTRMGGVLRDMNKKGFF